MLYALIPLLPLAAFLVGVAAGGSWTSVAVSRLWDAHLGFIRAVSSGEAAEHGSFDPGNFDLAFQKALLPLLKRPWRADVRLYYVHRTRRTSNDHEAWASEDHSGRWECKVWVGGE